MDGVRKEFFQEFIWEVFVIVKVSDMKKLNLSSGSIGGRVEKKSLDLRDILNVELIELIRYLDVGVWKWEELGLIQILGFGNWGGGRNVNN